MKREKERGVEQANRMCVAYEIYLNIKSSSKTIAFNGNDITTNQDIGMKATPNSTLYTIYIIHVLNECCLSFSTTAFKSSRSYH